jgi:fructose-bisphosphate aldolase class I
MAEVARALVVAGKGLLAADESMGTIGKRFAARGIPSTTETRRAYRELLLGATDLSRYISGVILFDETIRQADARGVPFVERLARVGIIPGIKVDLGAHALAGCPGEVVTDGLDGLRARLAEYRTLGARFAKWRGVIRIAEHLPSDTCLDVNAHALARYAALCQEEQLVPIVEPEVVMDGNHSLARCEAVTGDVLEKVFRALRTQRVSLEEMLLKPNMVLPGNDSRERPSPEEVASATLRVLRRNVPAAVPGIAFLSGGQDARAASARLHAMHVAPETRPWAVTFSFSRALQDPALEAWGGRADGVEAAQRAFLHRARLNSAASTGNYEEAMEESAEAETTLH